jgi:hypothetical protein
MFLKAITLKYRQRKKYTKMIIKQGKILFPLPQYAVEMEAEYAV